MHFGLGRRCRATAIVALASVGATMLAACGAASHASTAPITRATRIVLVVEENHSAAQVIGARDLPTINRLARSGVQLDHFYATTHPSLPNYLALTGGSTFGIKNDCTACTVSGANLFDQLQQAGITWRVYAQGLPGRCSRVAVHDAYVRRHVPALVYKSVLDDPAACAKVVRYDQFAIDARSGHLPTFSLVIPDLRHDMHGQDEKSVTSGDLHAADTFVAQLASTLDHAAQWHAGSRLVLTFDEGGSYSPPPNKCCNGDAAGGHIATFVDGPDLGSGHDSVDYDHYALLRSIETALGLRPLGKAASNQSHAIPALVGTR